MTIFCTHAMPVQSSIYADSIRILQSKFVLKKYIMLVYGIARFLHNSVVDDTGVEVGALCKANATG